MIICRNHSFNAVAYHACQSHSFLSAHLIFLLLLCFKKVKKIDLTTSQVNFLHFCSFLIYGTTLGLGLLKNAATVAYQVEDGVIHQ